MLKLIYVMAIKVIFKDISYLSFLSIYVYVTCMHMIVESNRVQSYPLNLEFIDHVK